MKTAKILLAVFVTGLLATVISKAQLIEAQNLLTDPGFESGAPIQNGWALVWEPAFSKTFTHSGSWSMEANGYQFGLGGTGQRFVTSPGSTYTLTGFGFTPTLLTGASDYAYLHIFFVDDNFNTLGGVAESPVHIDSNSPVNTWIQMSLTHTAPVGAVTVYAGLSLWAPDRSQGSVYFDDLSLVQVPEPSALALLGMSFPLKFLSRRRR